MTEQGTEKGLPEFSPKTFLLQARSLTRYIFSKLLYILGFAILCGVAAATYSFFKKPIYEAEITFALDDGITQSSGNSIGEIGEQLGIGFPGDAGAVFSSPPNIVELMQSRLLIEKTLRSKTIIDGRSIRFTDFFLDSLNYRKKWLKNIPKGQWDFGAMKKNRKDTIFENGLIKSMYDVIRTKTIKTQTKGKGTSIISVTCVTEHELFSKYFLEALLDNVTQYYIETRTQRSKLNLALIQKRVDSIRTAFSGALYGRAAFTDANINPIRQTAQVSGEKQQTDIVILRTSYVELARSLEAAKTSLMKDTPLIQYLDIPILPLKKTSSNMIKYFIIFSIVSGILFTVYLIMRKLGRRILNS